MNWVLLAIVGWIIVSIITALILARWFHIIQDKETELPQASDKYMEGLDKWHDFSAESRAHINSQEKNPAAPGADWGTWSTST